MQYYRAARVGRVVRVAAPCHRPMSTPAVASGSAPETDAAPCTSFDVELLVAAAAEGGDWQRAQALLVGAAHLGVNPSWRAYTIGLRAASDHGWAAALSFVNGLQHGPYRPTAALCRAATTLLAQQPARSTDAAIFLQEASARWGIRQIADGASIKCAVTRCVEAAREEARRTRDSAIRVCESTRPVREPSAWADALRLAPVAVTTGGLSPDVVSLFLEAASLCPPGKSSLWEAALRLATLQRHMRLAQHLDQGSDVTATAVTPLSTSDLRFMLRAINAAQGGWVEGLQMLRVASDDEPCSRTRGERNAELAGAAGALLLQSSTMWAEGVRCALRALRSSTDEDALRCLQSFVASHPSRGLERSLLHAIHAAPRPTTAPALGAACDCVTTAVQGDPGTWHYALNLLMHPKRGLAASQESHVRAAVPELIRCVEALSDSFPQDASRLGARMEATVSALCTPALAPVRGAPMEKDDAPTPTEALVCGLLQSVSTWSDVTAIQRRFQRTCRSSRYVGLHLLRVWARLGDRDAFTRLLRESEGARDAPPRKAADVLFAALLPGLTSARYDVRENARSRVRVVLQRVQSPVTAAADSAPSLRVTSESLPIWAGIAAAATESAALRLVRDAAPSDVRDAAVLTAVHAAAVGRDLKLAAALGAYMSDAAAEASARDGPLLALVSITAAAQSAGTDTNTTMELEAAVTEVARRLRAGAYSLDRPAGVLPVSESVSNEGEGLSIEAYAMRRTFIYAFSCVFAAAASTLSAVPDAAAQYRSHAEWVEAMLDAVPALRSKLFSSTPHRPVATFDAGAAVMLNAVAAADAHAAHALADAMLRRWACGAGSWVWAFRMQGLHPAATAAILGACARIVRDAASSAVTADMVHAVLTFAANENSMDRGHSPVAQLLESVMHWAGTNAVVAPEIAAPVFACVASIPVEAVASVSRRIVTYLQAVPPSARPSVAATCLGDPRTADWLCEHSEISHSGEWWVRGTGASAATLRATSLQVRLRGADAATQPEDFRRRWRQHVPAALLHGPSGWRDALGALPLSVATRRTVLAPSDIHPVLSAVAAAGDWEAAAAALRWTSAHAPAAASSVTGAVECLDLLAADGRLDEVTAYARAATPAPSARVLRAVATAATQAVSRGRPMTRMALELLQRTNKYLNDDAVARVVQDAQNTSALESTSDVKTPPSTPTGVSAGADMSTAGVRASRGPAAHIWTNARKLRLAHHVPYLLSHAPAVALQPPMHSTPEDALQYAKFLEPFAVVAAAVGAPVEARHVAGIWYRQDGASRAHLVRLYHDRIDTETGARLAEQLGGWRAALAHFLPHVAPLRTALRSLDPDARRAGIDAVMRAVAAQASRGGSDALARPFAPHVLFRHLRPILRPILLERRRGGTGDAVEPPPAAPRDATAAATVPLGDSPQLALDIGRLSLRAGDKFSPTRGSHEAHAFDDAVLGEALAAIGTAMDANPELWREALRHLEAEAARRVPGCGADELSYITRSWWQRALALVGHRTH